MGAEHFKRLHSIRTEMKRATDGGFINPEIVHRLAFITFCHPESELCCYREGHTITRGAVYAEGENNDPAEGLRRLEIEKNAPPICDMCGNPYVYSSTEFVGAWDGRTFK